MPGLLGLSPESRGDAPGRGRLDGRRILVVGAGQARYGLEGPSPIGNGRAISLLCAREGAAVALADIDEDGLRATARMVDAEGRATATVCVGDASREEDVERVIWEAVTALGGLDGVVVVVGRARPGDLQTTSVEDWDWTFATNVRSHFLTVRHALRVLEPGSSIVMISSIAAYAPMHELVAYHASKAALDGIRNVAAQQAASKGIRINIVAPGSIDTGAARHGLEISPGYRAAAAERTRVIPLQRMGTGWDIAYPTVFLLSNEAAYMTGQTLVADGGLLSVRR